MKTASWFTQLPDDHKRIGISRGTPRRMAAGYRLCRTLAPGPWFDSVGIDEYYHRYRTEILAPLNGVTTRFVRNRTVRATRREREANAANFTTWLPFDAILKEDLKAKSGQNPSAFRFIRKRSFVKPF